MIIEALVIGNLLYLLAFDYLPSELRLMMAGGIGVGYIALATVGVLVRSSLGLATMFAGVVMMLAAWALGAIFDPFESMRSIATADVGLRYTVSAMSGVAILCFADRMRRPAVVAMVGIIAVTLVFALVIAMVMPAATLGEAVATRFAPFTGTPMALVATSGASEPEGLHSSGYVIALYLLILLSLWQGGQIPSRVGGVLIMLAAILVLGYQVRTSWVLLIVYFAVVAGIVIVSTRSGVLLAISAGSVALALIALGAIYLLATVGADDLIEFSSGRTGTYSDRMVLLRNRSIPTLLFGSGPGSDVVYSSVWWWEAKNSHNDFLTSLIEGGLLGLAGRIVFLVGIVMHAGRWALPHVGAIVGSSMISNALFGRSMIMPLIFLAIALLPARQPRAAAVARHGGATIRPPVPA